MYRKVIVIDDNKTDLVIARRFMDKVSFAKEVVTIDSAIEALDYIKSNPDLADIIFLDINMPEMNGFEFLDEYMQLESVNKQNCNIVMLTSSLNTLDRNKATGYKCVQEFLNKPLNEEKLKKLANN